MLGWMIVGFLWPALYFIACLAGVKFVTNEYPAPDQQP